MRSHKWLVVVLVLVGVMVRWYVASSQPLWFDEVATWQDVTQFSYLDIIRFGYIDSVMPLFVAITKLGVDAFGPSEVVLRLPALLGSVLFSISVVKLLRLLDFSPKAVLFGVVVLTFSPGVIEYGSEARPYMLMLWLQTEGLIQLLTMTKLGFSRKKMGILIAVVVLSLLLSLISVLGWLVVLAVAYGYVHSHRHDTRLQMHISLLAVVLVLGVGVLKLLGWLSFFSDQVLWIPSLNPSIMVGGILHTLATVRFWPIDSPPLVAVVYLQQISVFMAVLLGLTKVKPSLRKDLAVGLWLLGPLLLLAVSLVIVKAYIFRYALISLLGGVVALVAVWDQVRQKYQLVLALVLGLCYLSIFITILTRPRSLVADLITDNNRIWQLDKLEIVSVRNIQSGILKYYLPQIINNDTIVIRDFTDLDTELLRLDQANNQLQNLCYFWYTESLNKQVLDNLKESVPDSSVFDIDWVDSRQETRLLCSLDNNI